MQTTIVTGFSGKGYDEYGKRFLDSFRKYNSGFDLHLYTDGVLPISMPLVKQYQQDQIKGLPQFLARWDKDKAATGCGEVGGWNKKECLNKYSYRYDAAKFCKMVYTMWSAAHLIVDSAEIPGSQYMIWLDGDTVVRKFIPVDLPTKALPDEYDFAYLGREPKHTETGFLVFKLPECLPILDSWVEFYDKDLFFQQKEWHSAFLFDRAREKHPGIKGFNLTPGGRGHVIHQCFVGTIFDHTKGRRKTKGRSPEAK